MPKIRRYPNYQGVTTWFLNGSTGSDSNNGTGSGTPLKTWAALNSMLGRGTMVPDAAMTVTIQSPTADPIVIDNWLALNGNITITGTWATARSGTITSVTQVNEATNTPYEIADTGNATFPFVGQLAKITGGNGGARTGNFFVIAKDTSSGTSKARITTPNLSDFAGSTASVVLAANDTYAVLSQSAQPFASLNARGQTDGSTKRLIFQDLNFDNAILPQLRGDNIVFQRCQFGGAGANSFDAKQLQGTFYACSMAKANQIYGSYLGFDSGGVIGATGVPARLQANANSTISLVHNFLFQYGKLSSLDASVVTGSDSMGFMDCEDSISAILVNTLSRAGAVNLWGSLGSPNAVRLTSSGLLTFTAGSSMALVGTSGANAAVRMDYGGNSALFVPFSASPTSDVFGNRIVSG